MPLAVLASDVEASLPKASAGSSKQGNDCFLAFCRAVNTCTGISAVLCAVAFTMALCAGPSFADTGAARLQVMRCYGIVLALSATLVETEWAWLLSMLLLLNNWFVRGATQAFVAVLTLEIATSQGTSDFDRSLSMYRQIAGYALLGCAGFYITAGLLCIGALKQERKRRLMERHKVEQHLESLEKQQEELRGLLSVYGGE